MTLFDLALALGKWVAWNILWAKMAHLLSVLTALMCDRLSQRIASCANDEFFALDHGLQGHPQAEEPSGDQTPTLLLGRSWAEKPGVSRTPGQPFTRKLFGRRQITRKEFLLC